MGIEPIIEYEDGVTVSEAAETWGISVKWVYHMIDQGRIPTVTAYNESIGKPVTLIPWGTERPEPKRRGPAPNPSLAGRKNRCYRLTDSEHSKVQAFVQAERKRGSQ